MLYKVGWGKSGVLEDKSGNICDMRKKKLLWIGGGLEELSNSPPSLLFSLKNLKNNNELDGHGKAPREAARRRHFE